MQSSSLMAQEAWLRREGFALLIPGRRRLARVPTAMAPLLLGLILFAGALEMLLRATDGLDDTAVEELTLAPEQALGLMAGFGLAILAIPLAGLYYLWQRHWPTRLQRGAAAALTVLTLLLPAVTEVAWWEGVTALAVIGLSVYFELPSILAWAARCVGRSLLLLGPMVAHALPFLLLAQLLVFFTAELWQMIYTFDQAKMWAVNALLFAPTVLLIATQSAQALRTHLDLDRDPAELLAGTPFEGIADRGAKPRLRLAERVNLLVLPAVTHLIQVLLFIVLLCGFFLALGSVALTPDLISRWTERPPTRLVFLGIALPIDLTMFRVSLLISVFSGLAFAASNATDATYRDVFQAPIVDELERGLAARRLYSVAGR